MSLEKPKAPKEVQVLCSTWHLLLTVDFLMRCLWFCIPHLVCLLLLVAGGSQTWCPALHCIACCGHCMLLHCMLWLQNQSYLSLKPYQNPDSNTLPSLSRRHRAACADPQRVHRRPGHPGREEDLCRGGQRGLPRVRQGPHGRHPRRLRRASGALPSIAKP